MTVDKHVFKMCSPRQRLESCLTRREFPCICSRCISYISVLIFGLTHYVHSSFTLILTTRFSTITCIFQGMKVLPIIISEILETVLFLLLSACHSGIVSVLSLAGRFWHAPGTGNCQLFHFSYSLSLTAGGFGEGRGGPGIFCLKL